MYLDGDDPRQGLAGVGAPLDGDAQGGRAFLHADQGGRGLQESRLQVRARRPVTEAFSADRPGWGAGLAMTCPLGSQGPGASPALGAASVLALS